MGDRPSPMVNKIPKPLFQFIIMTVRENKCVCVCVCVGQANSTDKPRLQAKYRNLRNRAVSQMRQDTLDQNAKRISEAKNEGETWKVVNDIIRPRTEAKIYSFIHSFNALVAILSSECSRSESIPLEKIRSA